MGNRDEMLAKLKRDDMIRRLKESDSTEQPEKSMFQQAGETVNDFMTGLQDNPVGRLATQGASYISAAGQKLYDDRPYEQIRQEHLGYTEKDLAAARERSPVATGAGSFAGNVGAGPMGAAGIGANMAVDAGMGALDAASQGAGVQDSLTSGAVSGAISGLTGGATKLAGMGIEKVAPKLDSMANKAAVNALGGSPKEQALLNKNADELGQLVRDKRLVRFGDNAQTIAGRVDDEIAATGRRIGEVRDRAGQMVDIKRLMDDKTSEIARANGLSGTQMDEASAYLKEFKSLPDAIPVKQAQGILETLDYTTPAYRDLRKAQSAAVEGSVSPEAFQGYQADMRNRYLLGGADNATNRMASRAQANETLGMKDLLIGAGLGGGAYAASEDPTTALGIAIGSKIVRSRGPASVASAADKIARAAKSAPQTLGKWGPALQAAAARGTDALNTNIFLLQKQDPEFRQFMEQQNESP